MRDVLSELTEWWRSGQPVGMATVVGTWRSAPRPAGATMLVGQDGTAVGSVSGGCVEGAVYELCKEAIDTGNPVLQRYGVSDDDAFAVGLTCGGIIDLFVERVDQQNFPELGDVAQSIDHGEPVAIVRDLPWLGDDERHWEDAAATSGRILLAGGLSPENVRAAIEAVQPWCVDASRSLEPAPGVKDHGRIRAFVDAVRSREEVRA